MEVDISNKTIIVLVVLTVIISVLSTMVVLNEVSNLKIEKERELNSQSQASGIVSLEILPDKGMAQSTGRVSMVVLR